MFYACSPRLPARASPIKRCAPGALSPACGLTSQSPPRLLSGGDRPDQQALPPRGRRTHLAEAGVGACRRLRRALPAQPPPRTPPLRPQPSAAYSERSDVVQVRRAWRWSRRSSPRSSSGCTSSAPPSVACTPCPPSRQASPPSPRSLPPSPAPCTLPHAPAAACGVVCRLRCLPLAV